VPKPFSVSGDEDISSGQADIRNEVPINDTGIIKCQTCDLYFKQYAKPQYNEIQFNDGDLHCDKCYNRIVDEKANAWKLAFPAYGGVLSTKRKLKVPIKLEGYGEKKILPLGTGEDGAVGQRNSHQQTRFSLGKILIFIRSFIHCKLYQIQKGPTMTSKCHAAQKNWANRRSKRVSLIHTFQMVKFN